MPGDEISLARKFLRGLRDKAAQVPQIALAIVRRHGFDERM